MGGTLLILFFFALCVAGILVAGVVVFFATRGMAKKWRFLFLLLVPVPFMLLFYNVAGPYEPTDPAKLARAFETEFQMSPPGDVKNLRVRQVVVGNAIGAWLTFEASPATVDKLLPRFKASDKSHFDGEAIGGNTPSWWTPDKDGMVSYYASSSKWRPSMGSSRAVLAHDAAKRMIYFHHGASD